jgi:murein DD-endopeptidase MepM/ murein hydrolase activator NlpD
MDRHLNLSIGKFWINQRTCLIPKRIIALHRFMQKDLILFLFKKTLTPITIMVIPHENLKSLNLKVPFLGLLLILLVLAVGVVQTCRLVADGLRYPSLVKKVNFLNETISEWNSTINSLKETERDFRRILSFKSKHKVVEEIDTPYSGDIDIQNLMGELQKSVQRMDEIKDYLRVQKNLYLSTPRGYPLEGYISSHYGDRYNPFNGERTFHSGLDISAPLDTPIRTTADGVVSYSGWAQSSGYLVVIEHGCGFSTAYAHNKSNTVKTGQKVKRGEVIGHVGSSGKSTGPHVHYEVWEKGKRTNPDKFVKGSS